MKTYKGYTLQTVNGSTYIYKDNELKGCTHSDEDLDNSRDRRFNKKIGLKKKNNIWVVYLINKEIITDICYFDRQDMALKNIKENKKRYLETV